MGEKYVYVYDLVYSCVNNSLYEHLIWYMLSVSIQMSNTMKWNDILVTELMQLALEYNRNLHIHSYFASSFCAFSSFFFKCFVKCTTNNNDRLMFVHFICNKVIKYLGKCCGFAKTQKSKSNSNKL